MEKVTLFLMTSKGFSVLKAVIDNNYSKLISKVIYAEDRHVEKDYSDEIVTLCNQNSINCFHKNNDEEIDSNLIIAISWRWIISTKKNQKLIVLHDSLLPKYRGFSPLVTALLNKDNEIGVTALFATKEYDKGNIISQSKIRIKYPIKLAQAIKEITTCYIDIILFLFESFRKGNVIDSIEQKEDEASCSLWRDEDDYKIDWKWDAEYIQLFVNSIGYPYKGASTFIEKTKIRITDVEVLKDLNITNRVCGKVLFIEEEKPVIVTGKGLIKIISAKEDETGRDILPFKKFRIKLN